MFVYIHLYRVQHISRAASGFQGDDIESKIYSIARGHVVADSAIVPACDCV